MKRRLITLLTASFIAVISNLTSAEVRYDIIRLGDGSNQNLVYAFSINNAGQIAGAGRFAADPGGMRPYRYTNGVATDLGTLGGSGDSFAYNINNLGQVVGYARMPNGTVRGFVNSGGTSSALGLLPGYTDSTAWCINDNGQIVGSVQNGSNDYHAVTFNGAGSPSTVVSFGGSQSVARAINNLGQIIGWAYTSDSHERASLWIDGAIYGMGFAGVTGNGHSHAYAINAAGEVVGDSFAQHLDPHAFRYTAGVTTDLGEIIRFSLAYGINNLSQVVGVSNISTDPLGPYFYHAVMFENGAALDLNDLIPPATGWELTDAFDINDSGWIVGSGRINGVDSAYVLIPVPEPSSTAVLSLMLVGIIGKRAREC